MHIILALILLSTTAHSNTPTIKIDGSSTVFPITEAVAEEFQIKNKGKVRVTVGISGTGGGFKKLCRGETDIQNASRPILKTEMDACKTAGVQYFELPVGFDAIAVVVNPKNNWINSISVEDLKKMWEPNAQNNIMKWSDVNPKWPNEKLSLYGAGADSGTFDYFTEAVSGKSKASRGDYTASEDDNSLVQGLASDQYALGFLPFSYYDANKSKLKLLGIVGGPKSPKKDKAIIPTAKTVIDGTYYPLSRPIFIYVSAKSYEKAEIKEFVDYYLSNSSRLVSAVSYIPLPKKAYDINKKHLDKKRIGSIFKGSAEVGLTIDQILKRETEI